MDTPSPTANMRIDVLKYKDAADIIQECPEIQEIDAFRKYRSEPEFGINTNALVCYVVLLYSRDSFLSKKPLEELRTRKHKAAILSGLDEKRETIKKWVFDLGSEKVADLILGFIRHQNISDWTERCVIEQQLEECQMIRLRPVSSEKDKDLIDAFGKKATLTNHAKVWNAMLKELDKEIFQDHDDIRAKARPQRVTLETFTSR